MSSKQKNSLTAKEMYSEFKKTHPEVSYFMYKETLSRINKELSSLILEGHTLKLSKYKLGNIRIKKVKRRFVKPRINWGESMKRKNEGIAEYFVYYTDDVWFRWYWEKSKCSVKNKSVYSFAPTISNSSKDGNKNKLTNLLKTNPLAALNFKT
jgi:hypothetical protein